MNLDINYAAYESRIQAALIAANLGMDVDVTPEESIAFIQRMAKPTGAITVGYRGSEFGDLQGQGNICQEIRINFAVSIALHSLRLPTGVYDMLNKIRGALSGIELESGFPLRASHEGFVQIDQELWLFEAVYQVTMTVYGT